MVRFKRGDRILYGIVVAVIVTVFVVFGVSWCTSKSRDATNARTGQVAAEGRAGAAKDAVDVVSDSVKKEMEYEALTADNTARIMAAQGADQRVSDDSDLVARCSLCLRDTYRGTTPCVVLRDQCTGRLEEGG